MQLSHMHIGEAGSDNTTAQRRSVGGSLVLDHGSMRAPHGKVLSVETSISILVGPQEDPSYVLGS